MMFNTTGLLKPQIPHVQKLIDSLYLNNLAADLSETGCGKMFCASAISRELKSPTVIVGPKSILNTWKKTLFQFNVQPKVLIGYEKIVRGNTEYLSYPKNIDKEDRYFNAKLNFPKESTIILDESHKCKGMNSLQAGLMMAAKKQGYRTLMLSATQASSPLDMRAFGYSCNLHDGSLKQWRNFMVDCGAVALGRFAAYRFNSEDKIAQERMRWCHQNLFDIQKIASRLTHEDMKEYLPENQVIAEAYDMGQSSVRIQSIYDELELAIEKWKETTENYSAHILAEIIKARRLIEIQKCPIMAEMIEDLYDEGKSVVCFVNYTDSIELLKKLLELNPKFRGKNLIGYIYGEASHKQREIDEQEFQANRKKIILSNACSGGFALSFHDLDGNHPRSSIINPSFSAITLLQALGRIFRTNGKSPCYQRILFAGGVSIEERICQRVQSKLSGISMLNDGDLTADCCNWFKFALGRDY